MSARKRSDPRTMGTQDTPPRKWLTIPELADEIYTIDEFQSYCDSGMLTDADGNGLYACNTATEGMSDNPAIPSRMAAKSATPTQPRRTIVPPPAWATHVVWFKKE